MTDDAKRSARVYLESCALGYAASVDQLAGAGQVVGAAEIDHWNCTKAALHDAGIRIAAALGNLDAAERAELTALRRFREGVVALRGEMATGRAADGDAICDADASYHVVQTIDALLFFGSPSRDLTKEPA